MLLLPLTFGCAPLDPPASLVVVARQPDGSYALEPRDRGDLDDPQRLVGQLGRGYRGGSLGTTYAAGGDLDIRWTMDHGDAVPLDEEGLVLWSFWYDLHDARAALEDRGYDLSPIFPVSIAWTPQSVLDFAAVENAAFVLGQRTFVLFPDALDEVPLAANAGVVRHELGHALFELVATGTSGEAIPWLTEDPSTQLAIRALNEGFADMIATLGLDDPRFIDASIPMESRDVTLERLATPDLYPPANATVLDLAGGYDPYALGTVFASFVWDVRLATDPDRALSLAIDAVGAYAAAGDWADVDAFVIEFLAGASGPALTAGCASAAARFPDVDVSRVCP